MKDLLESPVFVAVIGIIIGLALVGFGIGGASPSPPRLEEADTREARSLVVTFKNDAEAAKAAKGYFDQIVARNNQRAQMYEASLSANEGRRIPDEIYSLLKYAGFGMIAASVVIIFRQAFLFDFPPLEEDE